MADCNSVHVAIDVTTGEVIHLVQSDIKDPATYVYVKDESGILSKTTLGSLICAKCRTPISPGDGISLFYCESYLRSVNKLRGGFVDE